MRSVLAPSSLRHVLGWLAAAELAYECQATSDLSLLRIAPLEDADSRSLSFLASAKYRKHLALSNAAVILLRDADRLLAPQTSVAIVVSDPYLAYALVAQAWVAHTQNEVQSGAQGFRHPTATIALDSSIDASAVIGAGAVVCSGAVVAGGADIGAQCFVGPGVRIGADTALHPGVTVLEGCQVGQRCIIHSGAVIGADGFGLARDSRENSARQWVKIPQLASVRVGDDVEIGANTTIDRGALADTVIGNGVKLDNLVQVGHGARIGEHTAIAGCVGIAGSAVVGAYCTLGGGAIILGHLSIADHVDVSAATVVTRSIDQAGTYTGVYPFDDNRAWEKSAAVVRQLSSVRERLRNLEKKPS